SAALGLGNAYAYCRYFDKSLKVYYQPLARLFESRLVRKYATACIDTSDGLFPALSVLSEINNTGVHLTTPLQEILHPRAKKTCQSADLPSWFLLAGPHGEYELLFTIPAVKR